MTPCPTCKHAPSLKAMLVDPPTETYINTADGSHRAFLFKDYCDCRCHKLADLALEMAELLLRIKTPQSNGEWIRTLNDVEVFLAKLPPPTPKVGT